MTYYFRRVEKSGGGFSYNFDRNELVTKVVDTSDLLGVLDMMKNSKSDVRLNVYDDKIEDDVERYFLVVGYELHLMENYTVCPDYAVNIYVVEEDV